MRMRAFIKRAILRSRVQGIKDLLQMHKKPVIKLQSIIRRRYTERAYQKIKKSAIIIQKAYKRHLHKRFYLQKIWQKYRSNLYAL